MKLSSREGVIEIEGLLCDIEIVKDEVNKALQTLHKLGIRQFNACIMKPFYHSHNITTSICNTCNTHYGDLTYSHPMII